MICEEGSCTGLHSRMLDFGLYIPGIHTGNHQQMALVVMCFAHTLSERWWCSARAKKAIHSRMPIILGACSPPAAAASATSCAAASCEYTAAASTSADVAAASAPTTAVPATHAGATADRPPEGQRLFRRVQLWHLSHCRIALTQACLVPDLARASQLSYMIPVRQPPRVHLLRLVQQHLLELQVFLVMYGRSIQGIVATTLACLIARALQLGLVLGCGRRNS